MSFLLDVADPSIHFHARQGCNSPGSKPAFPTPSSSVSSTMNNNTTLDSKPSVSPGGKEAITNKSSIAGGPISALTARLGAIASATNNNSNNNINSNTNGSSNISNNSSNSGNNHLNVPTQSMFSAMSRMIRTVSATSASTTPLASSPPSGATTPDASSSHVSDPFNRIGSALSSPWMKPSVCDDDHMNKLVSFQL